MSLWNPSLGQMQKKFVLQNWGANINVYFFNLYFKFLGKFSPKTAATNTFTQPTGQCKNRIILKGQQNSSPCPVRKLSKDSFIGLNTDVCILSVNCVFVCIVAFVIVVMTIMYCWLIFCALVLSLNLLKWFRHH